MEPASIEEFARTIEAILSELERVVVGKRDVLELLLMAFLADGHVLIDDYPGLAKTLIARSLARVTGLGFGRIQFTPDLLPSDIAGSSATSTRRRRSSSSGPARSSPISSWPTRSTAPRPARSRRCWRRWRSGRRRSTVETRPPRPFV